MFNNTEAGKKAAEECCAEEVKLVDGACVA